MTTFGRMVTCNKCGNYMALYADDGKELEPDAKWAVTTPCPTCGYMVGTVIKVTDTDLHTYENGD